MYADSSAPHISSHSSLGLDAKLTLESTRSTSSGPFSLSSGIARRKRTHSFHRTRAIIRIFRFMRATPYRITPSRSSSTNFSAARKRVGPQGYPPITNAAVRSPGLSNAHAHETMAAAISAFTLFAPTHHRTYSENPWTRGSKMSQASLHARLTRAGLGGDATRFMEREYVHSPPHSPRINRETKPFCSSASPLLHPA